MDDDSAERAEQVDVPRGQHAPLDQVGARPSHTFRARGDSQAGRTTSPGRLWLVVVDAVRTVAVQAPQRGRLRRRTALTHDQHLTSGSQFK